MLPSSHLLLWTSGLFSPTICCMNYVSMKSESLFIKDYVSIISIYTEELKYCHGLHTKELLQVETQHSEKLFHFSWFAACTNRGETQLFCAKNSLAQTVGCPGTENGCLLVTPVATGWGDEGMRKGDVLLSTAQPASWGVQLALSLSYSLGGGKCSGCYTDCLFLLSLF